MRRVGITALLVLAACGAGVSTQPDGGSGADGAPGSGLSLAFAIDPTVPGNVENGLTIDSVDLAIKDLRLTGDAASATDDRTRAAYLLIAWRAGHTPFPATFPQAPPGLYSKIAFKLENDIGDAFHLRGSVVWNGKSYPYKIEDDNGISIDVPMNVVLPAGGGAMDTLQIHLHDVIAALDWSKATLELDGTLSFENDSTIRNEIATSFTAASIAPH